MSVFKLSRLFSSNSLVSRNVLCLRNTLKCCDQQHMFLSNKKILEELGIPLPPKKPPTPFLKYIMAERPKLMEDNPNLKYQEVLLTLSKQWSECDPERKKLLRKEYLQEMSTYIPALEKYKQSITSDQQNLIQNLKNKYKQSKEFRDVNKKRINLGKPKRPLTQFALFVWENQKLKPDNLKYTEWISKLAKDWENLPPSEKEKYKKHGNAAFEQYKIDMLNWEESMIKQGHTDVLRSGSTADNTLSNKNST